MRTIRQVELTDTGRVLLEEARRTLAAATCAREAVQAVQGLLRGSLGVGSPARPGLLDQAPLFARVRGLSDAPISPEPPDGPPGPWTGYSPSSASLNDLETAVVQELRGDYVGMMFILVMSTTSGSVPASAQEVS